MKLSWLRSVLLIAFTLSLLACHSVVDVSSSDVKPQRLDPGVLSAGFDNGFRYYARSANVANESHRIELRLAVRSGSLNESDPERGYSHLLEHMAFRGTESYSAHDIEAVLDNAGLRWGIDVNATTHYGATVYRFSLHQNDEHVLPELFSLMSDWLGRIELEPADLAREKKIVEAEWRERYAHRNYIVDPVVALALSNSRYDNRPPAGSFTNINKASIDSLQSFWQQHYRPDNAFLVVAGHSEPWKLEPLIAQYFESLPVRTTSAQSKTIKTQSVADTATSDTANPDTTSPDTASPDTANPDTANPGTTNHGTANLGTPDKNSGSQPVLPLQTVSYVNTKLKLPELVINFVSPLPSKSKGSGDTDKITSGFRNKLLFDAFTHLLRNRLLTTDRCNDVSAETLLLETGQSIEKVTVTLLEEDYLSCLSYASTVVEKLQNTELTIEEFQQFRTLFADIAQSAISRYRSRDAVEIAENLTDAVLNHEPLLSAWDLQTLLEQLVEDLHVAEFNNMLANIDQTHRVIYSLVGNKVQPPDWYSMQKAVASRTSEQPRGETARLINGTLKTNETPSAMPVDTVATKAVVKTAHAGDYHEWRLSNGARVSLFYNERFSGVAMSGISSGGYLQQDESFNKTARFSKIGKALPEFISANGVGGYTRSHLRRLQNNRQIYTYAVVDPFSHGIVANSPVEELPMLLSLVTGYFSEPMIIQPASDNVLRRINEQQSGVPWHQVFWDSQKSRDHNSVIKSSALGVTAVEAQTVKAGVDDFRRAQQFLYATPANFDFVFAGSVLPEVLERELQRLAKVSGQGLYRSVSPVSAELVSTEDTTLNSKSFVNSAGSSTELTYYLVCNANDLPSELLPEHQRHWRLLADIVSSRFRLSIREDSGLAYDITSSLYHAKHMGTKNYNVQQLNFSVAHQDKAQVTRLVNEIFQELQDTGVTRAELRRAVAREQRADLLRSYDNFNIAIYRAKQWLTIGDIKPSSIPDVTVAALNHIARCLPGSAGGKMVLQSVGPAKQKIGLQRAPENNKGETVIDDQTVGLFSSEERRPAALPENYSGTPVGSQKKEIK